MSFDSIYSYHTSNCYKQKLSEDQIMQNFANLSYPAHRCKKKNYKPLCSCSAIVIVFIAYLALVGLMNLLAQLSDRIIDFS